MNPRLIPLVMGGDLLDSVQQAPVSGGAFLTATSLSKPSQVCTLTVSSSEIKATVASE